MRNSKREFISLAAALGIILLLAANLFQGRIFATADDVYDSLEVFSAALDTVQEEYVREVSSKDLIQGALIGMLGSLDRHSSYMSPRTYTRLMVETEGEYEGVGIQLDISRNWAPISASNPLTVRKVFPGTPAFRSDVIEGDRIIKVDGENTEDMSLDDAVDKIKGPSGTKVTLTMQRIISESDDEKVLDIELERARIPLLSVAHTEITEDGIGYIRLADFRENSATELKNKIAELQEQGMKALVLDLRYNPGGLLSTAAKVADLFLPKGIRIVSTKREREPPGEMVYKSKQDPILTREECPMAMLVNGASASGSEIVTSALQENGRAVVVGAKTYGKGSVQTVRQLKDKSALKITTAYYYTPRGKRLSGEGIEPDIKIALSEEDDKRLRQQLADDREVVTFGLEADETPGQKVEDVQLKEAITVLRGYVILAKQEKGGEEIE